MDKVTMNKGKTVSYWNGENWEEKPESYFPGVDMRNVSKIYWRGENDIEVEYENTETHCYRNIFGTYVFDY